MPLSLIQFISKIQDNTISGEIYIQNSDLTLNDAKKLCDKLATNNTITSLRIENCRIQNGGLAYLANALNINKTIKTLSIVKEQSVVGPGCTVVHGQGRILTDGNGKPHEPSLLSKPASLLWTKLLQYNTTLTTLDLSDTYIPYFNKKNWTDALKHNRTLEVFRAATLMRDGAQQHDMHDSAFTRDIDVSNHQNPLDNEMDLSQLTQQTLDDRKAIAKLFSTPYTTTDDIYDDTPPPLFNSSLLRSFILRSHIDPTLGDLWVDLESQT